MAASMVLAALVAGAAIAAVGGSALIVYAPYAAVGAILVIRRPSNPIGWLLTAIGWIFALSWLPVDATAEALASLTAAPVVLATAWFKWWWSLPLTLTLVAALAITFPTGRLPRTRWRRLAQLWIVAMGLMTATAAIWPSQEVSPGGNAAPFWMPNPLGVLPDVLGTTAGTLAPAIALPMLAMLVVAIGSMLVRLRRSVGVEHLQLRWLVAALCSIVLAIPLGFMLFAAFGSGFALTWLPATVAFALPPIAIGIAVTRYRLYEIDRIISRTVSWAVVTGVLVAAFAAVVIGLQALLAGFTQGETLAVAASTLVVFALFQPVRRRVQAIVDRRFDRARYDAERTSVAFAGRLRDQVDIEAVTDDLEATVRSTLGPASLGLWLPEGHP